MAVRVMYFNQPAEVPQHYIGAFRQPSDERFDQYGQITARIFHARFRFTRISRYALMARLTLSDTGTPTVC